MTRAEPPRRPPVLLALGALAVASCAPLVAVGCGSSAERRQPNAAEAMQRDRERAMEVARRAMQAENSGDADRAIELYRESIGHSPKIPAVWNNLGTLLMASESYSEAVSAFQRAAELDLADNRPLENIGLAYSRVGWSEQSLTYYERALDVNPSSLTALRGAIREAQRLGRSDHTTLGRIRDALLLDTDPEWRAYFERQRYRVEAGMRSNRP